MSESEAIDSLIPQRWWRGIPISEGVASFVRGHGWESNQDGGGGRDIYLTYGNWEMIPHFVVLFHIILLL
jgi:hypothetical protein